VEIPYIAVEAVEESSGAHLSPGLARGTERTSGHRAYRNDRFNS
jgi:hypothetical protein